MKAKTHLSALFMILAMAFTMQISAQSKATSPNPKKKFTFTKVSRDVKKESKKYEKDGWKVEPGNLPISNQLDAEYRKQSETDDDGFPKWLVANGSSVAQTQPAAEMQAMEVAKNRLVGLIETNMRDVITTDVSNNQMDAKDAASLTKSMETATNVVAKKLSRVLVLFKIYRPAPKNANNTEVQVMVGYNYEMARKAVLDEMKEELKVETQDQRQKFDKFLSGDYYNRGNVKNEDIREDSSK